MKLTWRELRARYGLKNRLTKQTIPNDVKKFIRLHCWIIEEQIQLEV